MYCRPMLFVWVFNSAVSQVTNSREKRKETRDKKEKVRGQQQDAVLSYTLSTFRKSDRSFEENETQDHYRHRDVSDPHFYLYCKTICAGSRIKCREAGEPV